MTHLVNPLPAALAHYESAVRQTLQSIGLPVGQRPFPSTEMDKAGVPARLLRAARVFGAQRGAGRMALRSGDDLLVLWPALGLLEPVGWWRPAPGRVRLVVHDPEPLRRQYGSNRTAARIGGMAARRLLDVVTHSEQAADALTALGWPAPVVLPLPLAHVSEAVVGAACGGGGAVRVLGQYKDSRDLSALATLAHAPQMRGLSLEICGRGWPEVPGWHVTPRFLSEVEFDRAVATASCVVVPYRQVWQSDVALRAVEHGVPVVARRHPQLAALLGHDWPGLVDGDGDWPAAVRAVLSVSRGSVMALRERYRTVVESAWREVLCS